MSPSKLKATNGKALQQATRMAIGLGAISGMRAAISPAIVSHYLRKNPDLSLDDSKLRFFQLPVAAIVTKVLGAAEITVDKLPNTPNRIVLPQVIARVTSGAFAGGIVFKANRQSLLKGMLIGGASALAATFVSFYLRKYLDKKTGIQDPIVGGIEDIIALGSGVLLMKKNG